LEYDFNRLAPEGVSVRVSRVATDPEGTLEALEDMGNNASQGAELLAPARPDVVVFGCTSASFVNGPGWTKELNKSISDVVSCPVVSTADAMVAASRLSTPAGSRC
jgi:maleate cis-trans isomerase